MYYYVIERLAPHHTSFKYKVYVYYDDPMGKTRELDSHLTYTKFGARRWANRMARKLDKQGWNDETVEQQVISMPHA